MWRRLIGIGLVIGLLGMAAMAQAPPQQTSGQPKTTWFFYTGEMGRTG